MLILIKILIAISEQEHEFGTFMVATGELLFNKQISSPSIMHSVHGFLEDLESNNARTASIPLTLSILGNILIISN